MNGKAITDAQLRQFEEDGYLFVESMFDDQERYFAGLIEFLRDTDQSGGTRPAHG